MHCDVCHGELVNGRCPFCDAGMSERFGLVEHGFDWYKFWRWVERAALILLGLAAAALLAYCKIKGGW
jgi:hypothetical protein